MIVPMENRLDFRNVIDITTELKRRCDVRRANSDETWQQITASFALANIELDATNVELAGRVVCGEITLQQGLDELKCKYRVRSDA